MFAALRKLLPTGLAWWASSGSDLRKVLDGISPALERARIWLDGVVGDLHPDYTRELAEWEDEFGIYPWVELGEEARRATLTRRHAELGAQDPASLQARLQAEGFGCYVHEPWASTSPFVARDPRLYTSPPLRGTFRCGSPGARCGAPGVRCNAFIVGDSNYWDTVVWTGEGPPDVPDDPDTWPFFVYLGGEVFGDPFVINRGRYREFQYLVERLKPAHCWIVLFVDIEEEENKIFDFTFDSTFE